MASITGKLHPRRLRRTIGAAGCVTERSRFIGNELRDTTLVREYRLRGSSLLVEIRHPLLDMWVLEEVFRLRVYEPPDPVSRSLARLGRAPRIVDLGGHIGCFGLFMLSRYDGAELVSFEPDPGNAAILRRCVAANRLEHRWTVIEACASGTDGTAELTSSFHLSCAVGTHDLSLRELQMGVERAFPFLAGSRLLEREPHRVARRDALPHLAECDLIKIDIEGGEWELLSDPRLRDTEAVAMVLEYHPSYAPGDDPDELVREQLAGAGFLTGFSRHGVDASTLWAWRA